MMEEFFLKRLNIRVEVWQLGLLLIFALVSIVTFGAMVESAARDKGNAGFLSRGALKVARIPADSSAFVDEIIFSQHPEVVAKPRFEGEAGFRFIDTAGHEGDLLLLARFDGDAGRSIVELVDLDTGDVIHTYAPDIDAIRKRLQQDEKAESVVLDKTMDTAGNHRPAFYGMYHPSIEDDGSLIFKDFYTQLIKVDACSSIDWTLYGAFHHALERDEDGNYWTAGRMVSMTVEDVSPYFQEDTIAKFSSDGELLLEKSIARILFENDLAHLVSMGDLYQADPFHLNDVQPVLEDGPYWKRGDVFLSLRNRSTVILYRPATNKVLWLQQGPWLSQHDVDIVSDHEISVFSNNSTVGATPNEDVKGALDLRLTRTNDTIIYDFDEAAWASPYQNGYERNEIKTVIEGLSRILPNGDIFIEEQGAGRLLVMNGDGDLKWSYVNRAKDGEVYLVHWSRYIQADEAIALKQQIALGFECTN